MQTVQDVMTRDPEVLPASATLVDAARLMREKDIGPVLVLDDEGGELRGIVTDRDIVVRAVADGRDPGTTRVLDVCSGEVVAVSPRDPVDQAIELVRDRAVRRLPVLDDGRPVGILSLGDLALERDPKSALADVSAALPNR